MPFFTARAALLASASIALAACGGGDAPAPPAPPAVNNAPVLSVPATLNSPENTTGTVLTVTLSDPDGGAITLSLSGPDAAAFQVNSVTRQVSLVAALDFENPSDANADNVYVVSITATDSGGLTASGTFQLTVTNLAEVIMARALASGLNRSVQAVQVPGSDEIIIVQQGGIALVLNPATGTTATVPFLDVSGDVSSGSEQGLLGLAFSPDFATDRTIVVNLTNAAGDSEIRSYQTFSTTNLQVDPSTENLIITYAQPFGNHNAGWLGFDNNGNLLIPTGDGGSGGDPLGNAQNVNSLLGKVLRLDISSDDFPSDPNRDYAIPPTNPFATTGGAPEIFAIGLRNPFRAFFDTPTGDLYIGDVGQDLIEEISRITGGLAGVNFGWNAREGSQAFNGGADSAAFTPPLIDYPHGSGPFEGNSIVGGVVYRGPIAPLDETYIFADTISNNIWFVPLADFTDGSTLDITASTRLNDLLPAGVSPSFLGSIDLDASGNILLTSVGGTVFILEPGD